MLKRKRTLAILAASITLSLTCCAALKITTWIVKDGLLVHGVDTRTFVKAQGYRCYSLEDDTAWREQLKFETACCGSR